MDIAFTVIAQQEDNKNLETPRNDQFQLLEAYLLKSYMTSLPCVSQLEVR